MQPSREIGSNIPNSELYCVPNPALIKKDSIHSSMPFSNVNLSRVDRTLENLVNNL